MKKVIRLTESDLHRIINNSVKKIVKESSYYDYRENIDEIMKEVQDGVNKLKLIMYQEDDRKLEYKIRGFINSLLRDRDDDWDENDVEWYQYYDKPASDMYGKATFDLNTHPQTDRRVAATQYTHPDTEQAERLARGLRPLRSVRRRR